MPHAMAATACAPPAFSTCVTPAFFAQYSTSGVTCVHASARNLSLCSGHLFVSLLMKRSQCCCVFTGAGLGNLHACPAESCQATYDVNAQVLYAASLA